MDSERTNLGIEQILRVVRRRAAWILLCLVLVAAAAYGFSKHQTKKYTATASLTFSYNSLSQQVAGLSVSNSSSLPAQQASNLELVRLGDMAAKTASRLGHGLTAAKVAESLSVAGQGESSIVVVSATSNSPWLAAAVANTYTSQFVREQQRSNRQFYSSALSVVNRQLAKLSRAQRVGPDGLDLQSRAHTLALLAELDFTNVHVAQEALVPANPSSPKTKRNTILGAILGLLLGLGVAFLLERLDRRIRRPEDLETIYRLPLLGAIPQSTALARAGRDGRGRRTVLPQAEAEAFSLVLAHLRFFNVDRDLRTLVVASAEANDGKTMIARHLAEAAARLGSRVLLFEADLRHPTLAQQLDIAAGPGLADVLIGDTAIGDAIQPVEFDAARGEGAVGRSLSVLTAGAVLPPNPGELLESRATHTSLEWARWAGYDLVVIDTPPLSAVSDAFPLLTMVDGVVLVGRVGRSRRDAAQRLQQILASSGATLLGVIANSSNAGAPEPYPSADNPAHAVASSVDTSSEEFVPIAKT